MTSVGRSLITSGHPLEWFEMTVNELLNMLIAMRNEDPSIGEIEIYFEEEPMSEPLCSYRMERRGEMRYNKRLRCGCCFYEERSVEDHIIITGH